ncbi:MAG: CotH kinase family protein [Myxococcota bacterium]
MTGAGLWFWVAGGIVSCAGPSADDVGKETGDTPDTGIEVVDDTGPIDTDETGDTDETDDTGSDDELEYAAFFDVLEVQRIDLEISEEGLAALRADPDTYVEAVFVHDEDRVEEVGVRLKGGTSTFEDIDGKPSFKVKLDEFVSGQDYGGLDRVNLHNMKADPSQAREVLAAAMWEGAGLVAPRANYAEVYVNGALYGLYANVEEVDDAFVERRWPGGAGDLWEAGNDADLTPAGILNYSSAAGIGDDDALDLARRAVQTGEGAFYEVADGVLDMAQFLDFWAWQIATGNEDGYPYELDDHYLFADPEKEGRFAYVPWGLDETWNSEFEWDDYGGTVAVHCRYDTACAALLNERVAAALTTYEGLDVNVLAQAAFDVSAAAIDADTRRYVSAAEVLSARSALVNLAVARPGVVRGQMGL